MRLVNIYDPTEYIIDCIAYIYTEETTPSAKIRRPLASLAWVVDSNDQNRLVPLGATGELLIEGLLLSREYLNDIKRTSNSFIFGPL